MKTLITILLSAFCLGASAQTDVTARYVTNPNFEARFAGWHNNGIVIENGRKRVN